MMGKFNREVISQEGIFNEVAAIKPLFVPLAVPWCSTHPG